MNGKNFAKICKDCQIIDGKNVTTTDVDIVFSKVKAKSARVITFEQFNQALIELAPKRFKGKSKEEAVQQLYGLIIGKEPANAGVTTPLVAIVILKTTRIGGTSLCQMDYNHWKREGAAQVAEMEGVFALQP
ncbi:Tubulin polymerization-promoting protein member 3 [Ilyodon furcidens]|uniref:Tubulin polymerization-promoting protein member 3 n=1 Tax=Ilyodon furcidens TaxID=33524 RepID=A0ABV0ULA4_9TELE